MNNEPPMNPGPQDVNFTLGEQTTVTESKANHSAVMVSDIKESKKSISSFGRMMVLFLKTWSDLFSIKKVIFLMIFMIVPSLLVTYVGLIGVNLGNLSPVSATMTLEFAMIPMIYILSCGLIYTLFVGEQAAGLIADEVDRGTMLILVSKPIGRIQIFLGKYLAVLLFGALISAMNIVLTAWIAVFIFSGNIDHFIAMIPFMEFFLIYTLFLDLIFVSISMALSSIMKKGKKVGGVIIFLVMMTYFGFYIIRMVAGAYYVDYYIYWLDIGMHMGNIFVLINQFGNFLPNSTIWQMFFGMFTGVYDQTTGADPSQGIDLGGYPLIGYVEPIYSLILWVGLAVLLTIYGLIKLKTKEISN